MSRLNNYLWHKKNLKGDLQQEVLRWLAYYADYVSLPSFYPKDENEIRNDPIPWYFTCACSVIKETGWKADDVFTLSPARCRV